MDVQKKLDEIAETVGSARSMPMSASCVVNRAELLAMLDELRQALPGSLARAEELLGGREQMVEEARREAERIIESAHAQRGSLISDTAVAQQSRAEADRLLEQARREAEEIRVEADDYVDSKLANFEVVLTKTLGSVDRGREKLLGRDPDRGDGRADPADEDAPERSADPEVLRRRADAYVDAKLGAFEAVLAKTLEAVGRGRQKLHGRRPVDDLAAHMAAQDGAAHDGAGHAVRATDAEYLAGLAGDRAPAPAPEPAPAPSAPVPDQPRYRPRYDPYAPAAAQGYPQDPYGHGQDQYGHGQDPYGGHGQAGPPAPAHSPDPYAPAAAQGYPHDPYGAWQQPAEPAPQGYAPPHPGYAPRAQQPGAALDETSLFDTGMIDLDRLHGYGQDGR